MATNRFIILSAIMAFALILSTFIFSDTLRKMKSENQIITVTGSAKQVIVSDLGVLRGAIMVEAANAKDSYRALESQKPILIDYLKSINITLFFLNR